MAGWYSRIDFTASDYIHADDLNHLGLDIRTWGGDVNGGGYALSNVKLQGTGSFQYFPSPVEIVQAANGGSCIQLDQTVGTAPNQTQVARWSICKGGSPETGSDVGSNFAIGRYHDSGALIDTPFAINRASGVITMGAQQWAGNVNGGGFTLSNVLLSGVTVPGTVPTTRKINTGAGLSGGGDLSADLNLAGVVFKASGATHASGDVPDPGATAGTTRYLREDGGWQVPPGAGGGTANYWVNGALTGTQPTVNFIAGTNVTIGGVNNTANNRVDITITASGTGGTGSPQTPWASNINAAGFNLTSVGLLGVGTATPTATVDVTGLIRSNGPSIPAAGAGAEIVYSGGVGFFQAYDRTGGVFMPTRLQGLGVTIDGRTSAVVMQPTGGNVGIGAATPLRELHVTSVPAGGGMAITGSAPSLVMSNADTEPNTNTMAVGIGLSTASGNYALPHIGDSVIFNQGAARGDIHINSNYAGGGASHNVILQPGGGNVGIGTSNPSGKLTVSGTGSTGGGICDVQVNGTGTIGAGINLTSTDTGGRTWALLSTGSASGAGAFAAFDATAGSYAMWIDSAHNVAFGATQPAAKLHVAGATQPLVLFQSNGAVSPAIEIRDSAATPNRWWLVSGISSTTDGKFSIYDARQAVSRILIDTAGNVGVGTTIPATLFHVAAPSGPTFATFGPNFCTALEISPTTSIYTNISQNAYQASGSWALRDTTKEGWTIGFTTSAGAAGGISFARFAPSTAAASTFMVIGSTGYVGIGTISPTYQLHVFGLGGGQLSGNMDDSFPTGGCLFLDESSAAGYHGGGLVIGCNGKKFAAIKGYYLNGSNNGAGSMHFLTRTTMTDTTMTPKMSLIATGYLGIGTINPAYALDVVGDVNCTGAFRVGGVALSTASGIKIQDNGATATGPYQYLNFAPTTSNIFWTLQPGGPGNNTMTIYAQYSVSDGRLKQNVSALEGGISAIDRLRPIRAEWNGLAGRKAGRSLVSVIAQELQEVEPDAVYKFPAKLQPEDTETVDLLGVEPMALIGHLILAVQQLSQRLKLLEGKN